MTKLTPNLIVASIEQCLPFYVDRLGFQKTVEVPHEDKLGFVILQRGALSLMLQSQASLAADVPEIAQLPQGALLYLHVADLGPIRSALSGYPRVIKERTTFYGAREIVVQDPAGHVLFFAHHEAQ